MQRIRRWTAAAALVALTSSAAGLTLAPTSAAAAATSTLAKCTKITAETTNDRLVNGKFSVVVSPGMVAIYEAEPMNGPNGPDTWSTSTWFRDDTTGRFQSNTDKSYLALFCNGDLVLRRANGLVLWRSNTANRGVVKATISPFGNLLLLNSSGGLVWQSATVSAALPAGKTLASGSKLINRYGDQQGRPVQTLTMQPDGNLVHRSGSTIKWQSNTHVPGSFAGLSATARVYVKSPQGKLLWYSPCPSGSSYSILWLTNEDAQVTDFGGGRITHRWSDLYGC
ncbi:hypothetical protein V6K52_19260 [Knoellia sp. S7-12]|uniref:hypothetical protein n=1 Tax=Knoellia sp. S7-12 TaxID=3126698 RepID=UPI0033699A0C